MNKKIILPSALLIFYACIIITSGQTEMVSKNQVFPSLISSTADIDGGTAVFEYACLFSECNIYKDLSVYFVKDSGLNIGSYELYVQKQVTEKEPSYEYMMKDITCSDINGKDIPCQVLDQVYKGLIDVNRTVWDKIGKDYLVSQGTYNIRLVVHWTPHIGPQKVDWIPKATLTKKDYPTLDKDYAIEKSEWAWFNSSWSAAKNFTITEPGKQDRENEIIEINLTGLTFGTGYPDEIRIVNAGVGEDGTSQTYDILENGTDWVNILTKVNVTAGSSVNYSVYYDSDYYYPPGFDYEIYNFSVSGNIVVQWDCYHDQDCNATVDADGGVISSYIDEVGQQWAYVSGSMTGLLAADEPQIGALYSVSKSDITCSVIGNGYLYAYINCSHNTKDAYQEMMFYSGTRIVKDLFQYSQGAAHGVGGRFSVYGTATRYFKGYDVAETAIPGSWTPGTYNNSYVMHYNNTSPTRSLIASWDAGDMQDDYAANARNSSYSIDTNYMNLFNINGNGVRILGYDDGNTTYQYQGVVEVTNGNEEEDGLVWHERFWNPLSYDIGTEQTQSTSITATIDNPTASIYTVDYVDLNVSTDTAASACLYSLDGAANVSMYGSGTNWYIEVTGLSEGSRTIVASCNSSGGSNWDSDSVTFTIDTVDPTLNITSPENATYTSSTVALNVYADETISTWYYTLNGAANASFSPNTTITATLGLNYISVWANDTADHWGSYGPVWFTYSEITGGNSNYEPNVVETYYQNMSNTVDLGSFSGLTNFQAYLIYNGTNMSASYNNNGGNYTMFRSFYTPIATQVNDTITFSWFYSFDYDGGSIANQTTDEAQVVHMIYLVTCTGTGSPASTTSTLNFTIKYEDNQSALVGDLDQSFDVWLNSSVYSRGYAFDHNGDVDYYVLCIYPTWTPGYYVDMIAEYEATGFSKRTYYLNNASIDNTTETIPLYLKENDTTSLITMEVLNNLGQPQENITINIQRFFIGENTYRTISIAETDFQGEATTYLTKDTIWYRFVLSDYGEVVGSYGPTIITEDSLTFRIDTETQGQWFNYYGQIASNCTTSSATNTTTCVVTDTSGLVLNVRLEADRESALGWIDTCDEEDSGSSVTLVCSLGNTENNLYRFALVAELEDTDVLLDGGYIDFRTGASEYGTIGLIVALMLMIFLPFIGAFKPGVALAMSGVAVFISMSFGLLYIDYASVISLVLVFVIGIYKMRT